MELRVDRMLNDVLPRVCYPANFKELTLQAARLHVNEAMLILEPLHALEKLDLSHNPLGANILKQLITLPAKNVSKLKNLQLVGCDLGVAIGKTSSRKRIPKKVNLHLQVLNLSFNWHVFNANDVEVLSPFFGEQLKEAQLVATEYGSCPCRLISLLRQSPQLTHVDMSENQWSRKLREYLPLMLDALPNV